MLHPFQDVDLCLFDITLRNHLLDTEIWLCHLRLETTARVCRFHDVTSRFVLYIASQLWEETEDPVYKKVFEANKRETGYRSDLEKDMDKEFPPDSNLLAGNETFSQGYKRNLSQRNLSWGKFYWSCSWVKDKSYSKSPRIRT